LQKLLEDDGEALARKAIDLAKGGDLVALRMCMDRLMPARKHEPVAFELPRLDTAADTVAAAATIVAAGAGGGLAPSEAGGSGQGAGAVGGRGRRKVGRHLRGGAGEEGFRGAPPQAGGQPRARHGTGFVMPTSSEGVDPCRSRRCRR